MSKDEAETSSSNGAAERDLPASGREGDEQTSDRSWSGGGRQSTSPNVPVSGLHFPATGLAGLLKFVFYGVGLLLIGYLVWKYRKSLVQAAVDIWRDFRKLLARLFGRHEGPSAVAADAASLQGAVRPRRFSEFRDPFVSGRHQHFSPDELLRYTFEAFEAWARDRGCPRSPDRTPREFVQSTVAPQTRMYEEAQRMVRMYNELAYAGGTISRDAAQGLQVMWKLMRSAQPERSPFRSTRDSDEGTGVKPRHRVP